jgi:hypothetical protein
MRLKVFNYDFDPIAKIDKKKIGTKEAKKGAGMQDSFFCKELPSPEAPEAEANREGEYNYKLQE